jgi:hypothetical protein
MSIIKYKMDLLNLAEELQNVSQACRVMGVHFPSFQNARLDTAFNVYDGRSLFKGARSDSTAPFEN